MEHGRDDASRPVGRGRDHPPPCRILLVDRHGIESDPVDHGERVAQTGLGFVEQLALQFRRPAMHVQAPGQLAVGPAPAPDTGLHGLPDTLEVCPHLGDRAGGRLVGQHDLRNAHPARGAVAHQFVRRVERVRHGGPRPGGAIHFFRPDDEPAAYREPGLLEEDGPGCIEGGERHPVRMRLQRLAAVEDEVVGLVERDGRPTGQTDPVGAADGFKAGRHRGEVDRLRLVALEPQQHRLVRSVAKTGEAQRSVEFHHHPRGAPVRVVRPQGQRERTGRAHRPDRVRTGRADPDGEQIEHADMHARRTDGRTPGASGNARRTPPPRQPCPHFPRLIAWP